jgi:hypothetical protein
LDGDDGKPVNAPEELNQYGQDSNAMNYGDEYRINDHTPGDDDD